MRCVVRCAAIVLVFLPALSSQGGWWEAQQLDISLQLDEARREALESFRARPHGAEAAVLAGWWYGNLDNLSSPGEILNGAPSPKDPAVAFLLGLIESELNGTPPPGALSGYQLFGPWGNTGVLDIKRGFIPPGDSLPPIGTPWAGPGHTYAYWMTTPTGHLRTPQILATNGLVMAGSTFQASGKIDGWLVVEARGSYDLSFDGQAVDRAHLAGIEAPGVVWYRLQAEPGPHRIKIALGPAGEAAIRVTLLDLQGAPMDIRIQPTVTTGVWAESLLRKTPPPSMAPPPETPNSVESLLLNAELARLRGDNKAQRIAIDSALELLPNEPHVHLAAAAFFLFEQSAAAPEVENRRTREHLRHCSSLAIAPLVERLLAHRQGRAEDVERLRETLWNLPSQDPRILRTRLSIAIHNGWQLEIDEQLAAIEASLGPTEAMLALKAETYAAANRGREHRRALEQLVDQGPPRRNRLPQLNEASRADLAAQVAERLREQVIDPDLDADFIRLLMSADRLDEATLANAEAIKRWGYLPPFEDLGLALTANNPAEFERNLSRALDSRPGNIALQTLAWRRGTLTPFWTPFAVDALEFAALSETSEEDVDAVLLLDQAVERVFPDGSSLYYYHGLAKALTPAGAQQVSTLEQMPGNERLTLRIIKPDGTTVVPSDVSLSEGNPVISEVEPGDLVEEEYVAAVAAYSSAVRGHLSPYVYRFADSDRNFGLSEYVLVVDDDIDIKVDGQFDGLAFSDETSGSTRVMRWRSTDVPAVPNEPFAPPQQDLLPWVTYGFGLSWQDIGDSLRERLMIGMRSSQELDDFSLERLNDPDVTKALETLVEDLLQRVEAGPTLLDLSTTAAASFSRGRGNRLGVLAAALLAADWQTDIVLGRPAPLAGTHLGVPSRDLFGSPLIRVQRDGQTIWIDLREEAAGVNSISPILQGSDGLVLPLLNIEDPVFIEHPLPSYDNPHLLERSSLRAIVEQDGRTRIAFTSWLEEAEATRLVENFSSVPEDRIPLVYSRIANNLFPGASEVTGSIINEGDDVGLHLELELGAGCEPSESALTCRALVLNQPLAPMLASLPERNYPLVLQVPIRRRFETSIQPPAGGSIDRAPRQLTSRWGSVEESLTVEAGVLKSTLELTVPAVVVSPGEYPEFSRFCQAVDELMGRPEAINR